MIGSSYNEDLDDSGDLTMGEMLARRDREFEGMYSSTQKTGTLPFKDDGDIRLLKDD